MIDAPLLLIAAIVVVCLFGAGLMRWRGRAGARQLPLGMRVTLTGLPRLDEEYLELLLAAVQEEWQRRHPGLGKRMGR